MPRRVRLVPAPANPRPSVAGGSVDFSADQNEHKPRRRRGPSHFRAGDVKAAVQAVRKAGLEVVKVEIDTTGKIVVTTSNAGAPEADELDRELAAFEAKQHARESQRNRQG